MSFRFDILLAIGAIALGAALSQYPIGGAGASPSRKPTVTATSRIPGTPERPSRLQEILSGNARSITDDDPGALEKHDRSLSVIGLLYNPRVRWPAGFFRRREWIAPAFPPGEFENLPDENKAALCAAANWSLMKGVAITLSPAWALQFLQSAERIYSAQLDFLRISPVLSADQLRTLFSNEKIPQLVLGWCLLESFDWSNGIPAACRELLVSGRIQPGVLPFMLMSRERWNEATQLQWDATALNDTRVPPNGLMDPGNRNFTWLRSQALFDWLASLNASGPTGASVGQAAVWAAHGAGYSEGMTKGSSESLLARLAELPNPDVRRAFASGAISWLAQTGGAEASALVEAIKEPVARRGAVEALIPELEGAEREAWERELTRLTGP
jgi:hypothetical protein